jgi:hypothetical protein
VISLDRRGTGAEHVRMEYENEKVTDVPPQDEREDDESRPPKYDNAEDEGTIADGGHSASALGETGAKGERMDG